MCGGSLGLSQIYVWQVVENTTAYVKQHKVVEEQLHLAATICEAQVLEEQLQRSALDIALEANIGR